MAQHALAWFALACLAAVVYSYAVYPIVLVFLGGLQQTLRDVAFVLRKVDRRRAAAAQLPEVAVVIAAFNEEQHIGARIANLLALDYPSERIRVFVGSDGSTDGTADILRALDDPRVTACIYTVNRGKASVLNELLACVTAPVVVFSDANTRFDQQAIRRLVAHFEDPGVGAVSGELRLAGAAGDNQDSLYWRVEQLLKNFEARLGGLLGANGAIYAIRRRLWQELPPDTICDDFCVAMNIAAAGHRLVYEPTAWAEEDTPAGIGDEYARRVRIGIGNFQALFRHPEYLYQAGPATALTYLSHKVLRWVAPHLLLLALAASILLAPMSVGWSLAAAVQVVGYATATWLYRRSLAGRRLPPLGRMAAFLLALNWAFLVGSWRFATGRYRGSWLRTGR